MSVFVLMLAFFVPNNASAATTRATVKLTKNENTLSELVSGATNMEGMEVIVTKKEVANAYYEYGVDYVVLKNGDQVKNSGVPTYGKITYIDLRGGKLTDVYSIKLLHSDVKVGTIYYDSSSYFSASGGSFNNRAVASVYNLSEEEYKGFFRGRILGEVQVQKIPMVVVNNLVDGGILSTALILFAILLGVGLVRRYLSSLNHY